MWFSFNGWFFKRVGCGFLGAYFSLIFCQIKAFLSIICCCLILPKFNHCFYDMGLVITLGLPFYTVDLCSPGFDVLKSHLPTSSQHTTKLRNIARLLRRSYYYRTKFKHMPPQKWQCNNMKPCQSAAMLGGWASLPELLPDVQPLFQCFPNPPIVSVTCAQVFTVYGKRPTGKDF
jgi:hypothetical protein